MSIDGGQQQGIAVISTQLRFQKWWWFFVCLLL